MDLLWGIEFGMDGVFVLRTISRYGSDKQWLKEPRGIAFVCSRLW